MTLEARDPIPPGIYWLDLMDRDRARAFDEWASWWRKQDAVRVLSSQWDSQGSRGGFVVFDVLWPVARWPVESRLGLPTKGTRGMSRQDTSTVEPTPDWTWNLPDASTFGIGLGAAMVLGFAFLMSRK